jgi:hypothetical protein
MTVSYRTTGLAISATHYTLQCQTFLPLWPMVVTSRLGETSAWELIKWMDMIHCPDTIDGWRGFGTFSFESSWLHCIIKLLITILPVSTDDSYYPLRWTTHGVSGFHPSGLRDTAPYKTLGCDIADMISQFTSLPWKRSMVHLKP